jgi:predicted HicB family RNase H-like nuclease
MPQRKVTEKSLRLTKEDSTIIGFRLPNSVAQAVKVEAAQRQVALNSLFVEMWELYTKQNPRK